jgi:curli biogenesis system outer membrane secretion channel CsgG
MPRPFTCRAVAVLLIVAGSGCSSFVDECLQSPFVREIQRGLSVDGTETICLQVDDPQSAGVAHVHSIAVLDFTGPNKIGEALAAAVSARLATQGRWEVKDRQALLQAAGRVGPGDAGRTTAAQVGAQVGADAVLVGDVTVFEQNESGEVLAKPAFLKELQTRQATLTVDYRLVECKTGAVLLSRHAAPATAVRSLNTLNAVEAPPSAVQVQQRLLDQGAEEIVSALATPGRRTVERKFARRGGRVNSGNTYARQGVIDLAQQKYEEAVAEDAKNHAAWYNLGLVREAQGDFAAATGHFERAMKLCESELYIAAYQRARSAGAGSTAPQGQPPPAQAQLAGPQ